LGNRLGWWENQRPLSLTALYSLSKVRRGMGGCQVRIKVLRLEAWCMESDHDSWMHMILNALVSQVAREASAWWQLSLQDLSIISVAFLGLTFLFLPIFSIWHFVHVPVGVYWTKILFVLLSTITIIPPRSSLWLADGGRGIRTHLIDCRRLKVERGCSSLKHVPWSYSQHLPCNSGIYILDKQKERFWIAVQPRAYYITVHFYKKLD